MVTRLLLGGLLLAGAPAAAQTSLTIYTDGRVLTRATLPVAVPAGLSSHRLEPGALDPGTVFSLDPAVTLLGASYDAAVDEANTLRRAIGRRLVFETGGATLQGPDTVVAEVLGVNPERYRLADGTIIFARPGRPRYPADLVQLAPALDVSVRAASPRPSLALGWFTTGASWSASYDVVLSRDGARVTGRAAIPSQTLRVDDAEVQVLAGDVGRAVPPAFMARAEGIAGRMVADVAEEQAVGEVHLYTLPGRHSLNPGVTTTVALFEPATVPWERAYTVRGQVPWIGPLYQQGDEERVPVEVQYFLRRAPRSEFGDRPLPGGAWRLYEADAQGRVQLVGQASAGHTPAGQDLRLTAGSAFDLTAERVQTAYSTTREAQRTIGIAGYRVSVRNAKDSAVTVDVLEERRGEWSVLESSVTAERLSTTRTRFRLRVPAGGETVLTYRLRVVW